MFEEVLTTMHCHQNRGLGYRYCADYRSSPLDPALGQNSGKLLCSLMLSSRVVDARRCPFHRIKVT